MTEPSVDASGVNIPWRWLAGVGVPIFLAGTGGFKLDGVLDRKDAQQLDCSTHYVGCVQDLAICRGYVLDQSNQLDSALRVVDICVDRVLETDPRED